METGHPAFNRYHAFEWQERVSPAVVEYLGLGEPQYQESPRERKRKREARKHNRNRH